LPGLRPAFGPACEKQQCAWRNGSSACHHRQVELAIIEMSAVSCCPTSTSAWPGSAMEVSMADAGQILIATTGILPGYQPLSRS
jgi:hypothetical protein